MPTDPSTQGYALRKTNANVSPAAAIVRIASINATLSSYELPAKSRYVIDQGNLPCCVSCALGAAMEILNPSWPALAPLFHYYVTRYENGGSTADGSLFLDAGLATLSTAGICKGTLHSLPYTVIGSTAKPSQEAYDDALTRTLGRRGIQFRYVPKSGASNVSWIREQLSQDRPVVVGIQLPIGYPASFLNSHFEWLDPNGFQRSASGHCVLATGYNDARQTIHIQDCHGVSEFQRGCWWMGYRVADSSILQDAYSIIP